jgi:hypothetical protein
MREIATALVSVTSVLHLLLCGRKENIMAAANNKPAIDLFIVLFFKLI